MALSPNGSNDSRYRFKRLRMTPLWGIYSAEIPSVHRRDATSRRSVAVAASIPWTPVTIHWTVLARASGCPSECRMLSIAMAFVSFGFDWSILSTSAFASAASTYASSTNFPMKNRTPTHYNEREWNVEIIIISGPYEHVTLVLPLGSEPLCRNWWGRYQSFRAGGISEPATKGQRWVKS